MSKTTAPATPEQETVNPHEPLNDVQFRLERHESVLRALAALCEMAGQSDDREPWQDVGDGLAAILRNISEDLDQVFTDAGTIFHGTKAGAR